MQRHFESLESITQHADLSALTLSLLLSAGYPHATVQSIFSDMVTKEMTALESTPRPSTTHWPSLLSRSNTISPDLRPSQYTNTTFQMMLHQWKSSLRSSIIYPYCGSRSLSRQTLRHFNDHTSNDFDSISPIQLEQLYAETGVQIEGCCEMRQVWYPTIATPRTYYAMGGEAYFRSRYVRDIFNVLADFFSVTNRHTRVQPSHLDLDTGDEVMIYDLTSFTSLCHEQRDFLDFLANCMVDVDILMFDTHQGLIRRSVGDIIREYNVLNKEPEYSLERVWDVEYTLKHSVAGFLGVYGNLITCTIPHGLILSTVSGKPRKAWCAGDDAGSASPHVDESSRYDTFNAARTVGTISVEKTFSDQEDDPAIALKRQFVRSGRFCILQPNILFPPFSVFFEGDPRFRDDLFEHPLDRLHTFCSGLMSMLYQMSKEKWVVSDRQFLQTLLPELYRVLHLPKEGWFPPLCGDLQYRSVGRINFSVPRILGPFWRVDPNEALLNAYMPEYFVGSCYEDMKWDGILHSEWISNTNKHLNLMVKMGYLEREEVRVTYTVPEDVIQAVYRQYLRDSYSRSLILYKFISIGSIPELYSMY